MPDYLRASASATVTTTTITMIIIIIIHPFLEAQNKLSSVALMPEQRNMSLVSQ